MPTLSWITEYLAVGPRRDLQELKQNGIQVIIDLNGDPLEAEQAKHLNFEYHPARITDESSDDEWLIALDKITRMIHNAENKGEKVYVHCMNGMGRSPTAAMALLIDESHMLNEAVELVKTKNPNTWSSGNPIGKYKRVLERYEKLKHKQEKKKALVTSSS